MFRRLRPIARGAAPSAIVRAVTSHHPATVAELGRIVALGSLLGIKTTKLIQRLTPIAPACGRRLVVTLPHGLDGLTVSTRLERAQARAIGGAWIDELAGDELELELDATSTLARSDEAALPPGAPALVTSLGGELAQLGFDGTTWTYVLEQPNPDADACEATIGRIDAVAETLGITPAQRRIAGGLHRSLARAAPSRVALRARAGVVEPRVTVAWDRVEWQPIQSMLGGFYPDHGATGQLPRIARACEVDEATVELVLGITDPPAMRISMRLV